MSRRVSLPGADELFRTTSVRDDESAEESQRTSGRVRHDEKITVYVTAEELVGLEHARLELRRRHRIASDRGRIVREAIAIVLADLELNGGDSVLVDRLRSQ